MKAFVAGATGYVGKAVVVLLVERGVEVHAHVRPDSSRLDEHRAALSEVGAEVDTTAWTEDGMAATFARLRPDIVFGCIGTTARRRRNADDPTGETYEAIDYGLTAMLIRASAQLDPKPRFVYLSSTGTGPRTGSAYLAARWKAESELRDSGVPYTIARPAIISGTDREESRPAERVAAVVGDAMLNAAARIGLRAIRNRWASLTSVELATALVEFGLSSTGENRILDASELRSASQG